MCSRAEVRGSSGNWVSEEINFHHGDTESTEGIQNQNAFLTTDKKRMNTDEIKISCIYPCPSVSYPWLNRIEFLRALRVSVVNPLFSAVWLLTSGKNPVEHCFGQFARERVLLADVIGADEKSVWG